MGVKRFILLRDSKMALISASDLMEETGYSLSCIPLVPWSRGSGDGEARGYLTWVYYQPADERRVLSVLAGLGVDLHTQERVAVDPDSPEEEEQIIMRCRQQSHHISMWEHQLVFED